MKWFIYVIWTRDENWEEVRYYGHTNDIEDRKREHISSHKGWVKRGRPEKLAPACASVYILDTHTWNMDVLHELECDEKEASRVEGNYIRNNGK